MTHLLTTTFDGSMYLSGVTGQAAVTRGLALPSAGAVVLVHERAHGLQLGAHAAHAQRQPAEIGEEAEPDHDVGRDQESVRTLHLGTPRRDQADSIRARSRSVSVWSRCRR